MKLVISEDPIAFSLTLIKSSFWAAWLSWLWDTFIVKLILLIKNLLQKVVKVIWYKTASPPQTDGSVVFARWRQCALPSGHIDATWWIQLNLCFLRPSQVHSPNGKSISLAVSAQLTAGSLYFTIGNPFPKIAASHGGSGIPCIWWLLWPVWTHNPNSIMIGSAVFAQVTAECPYALQWASFHPKLPLPMGGLDLHLTHDFLVLFEPTT